MILWSRRITEKDLLIYRFDHYGKYSFAGSEGEIIRSKYTNVFVNNGKTVLMCTNNDIEFTRMNSFGSANLIFSNFTQRGEVEQEESTLEA